MHKGTNGIGAGIVTGLCHGPFFQVRMASMRGVHFSIGSRANELPRRGILENDAAIGLRQEEKFVHAILGGFGYQEAGALAIANQPFAIERDVTLQRLFRIREIGQYSRLQDTFQ